VLAIELDCRRVFQPA
jgi:hypothetical protein